MILELMVNDTLNNIKMKFIDKMGGGAFLGENLANGIGVDLLQELTQYKEAYKELNLIMDFHI